MVGLAIDVRTHPWTMISVTGGQTRAVPPYAITHNMTSKNQELLETINCENCTCLLRWFALHTVDIHYRTSEVYMLVRG